MISSVSLPAEQVSNARDLGYVQCVTGVCFYFDHTAAFDRYLQFFSQLSTDSAFVYIN